MVLQGLQLNRNKIHNFLRIHSTSGKIMIYVSSLKKEEHKESELSGKFPVKLVAQIGTWVPRILFHAYVD